MQRIGVFNNSFGPVYADRQGRPGFTGFGDDSSSGTFDTILQDLAPVATAYIGYEAASTIKPTTTTAILPTKYPVTTSTNWLPIALIGGAVIVGVLLLRRR